MDNTLLWQAQSTTAVREEVCTVVISETARQPINYLIAEDCGLKYKCYFRFLKFETMNPFTYPLWLQEKLTQARINEWESLCNLY